MGIHHLWKFRCSEGGISLVQENVVYTINDLLNFIKNPIGQFSHLFSLVDFSFYSPNRKECALKVGYILKRKNSYHLLKD